MDYCRYYWDSSRDFSHKIQLMHDHKLNIEHWRRLKPLTQEFEKEEIIRWLVVVLIYLIVNSSWVCPVQCVPKKGGMTVVPIDKNDFVSMSSVTG